MTDLSIHDFTVTLDTRESGGDKVVLHLDRDGVPRLTIACGATQLLWLVDDPALFVQGYRASLARNIVDCVQDGGWSFEQIATALGVPETGAVQLYRDALAAREEAEQAKQLAEVTA